MMKAVLCGWVFVLTLAGCAAMWEQPTGDRTTYEHDATACQAQAYASAMMARDPTLRRSIFETRLRECLQARGWRVDDSR